MTIRELITQLGRVDEDVADYEVWVTFHKQISPDVTLSARTNITMVPENVDVDQKRIYLKTRVAK